MKKWTYIVSGFVIGAIVATSGSAFADQVKSLVGQKVTGEYTITINGRGLQDKGAVIAGKTNVPVRSISEALGANVKVEGKTIAITTDATSVAGLEVPEAKEQMTSNKYIGDSKASLERNRDSLKNNILAPANKSREKLLSDLEIAKEQKADTRIEYLNKQIAQYDADISKYAAELLLVEEALAAIK